MSPVETPMQTLLESVKTAAEQAGVFGSVEIRDNMLVCGAMNSAEPAFYRVELHGSDIWVALVMEDRWQSGSIEGDLMHTGDKLEELLDEELADLGYEGEGLGFEHFRSEDMLFTFRSKVPSSDAEAVGQCLLAYEIVFRELGDMSGSDED